VLTGLGTLERVLDLLGVFVFALAGASLAVRKGFDVVGMVALAFVTALGGGVLRDLVIGSTPVAAVQDSWYLVVVVGAAGVVGVAHRTVEAMRRPVLVLDALGIGLFTVVGAVKALAAGLDVPAAVLVGTMAAVGGGIVRDVLARDEPTVFRADSTLYAIPAAIGAAGTAVVWELDLYGPASAGGIALGVTVIRLLALRFGWRAPSVGSRPA
jgi:uncharacterized membrane protein YeiH